MNRYNSLVSCLVPTHNGKNLLVKNLPALLCELKKSRVSFELIVIDDGSTDGTQSWFKEFRKGETRLKFLRLAKNRGFVEAARAGLNQALGRLILFLNNDISVRAGFLQSLLATFKQNPDALAIACLQEDQNGFKGWPIGVFKRGFLRHIDRLSINQALPKNPQPIFYASLGGALFDGEKIRKLGGPSPIFSPGYWEDTDLSFRGWQKGWPVLLDPKSRLYHPGETSMPSSSFKYRTIALRNFLLFNWLNLKSKRLVFFHLACLGPRIFLETLRGKLEWPIGFLLALGRLRQVTFLRRNRDGAILSDKEVVDFFNKLS